MFQRIRTVDTLRYIGSAAHTSRISALGGIKAQYIFKIDDVDFHLKIVADLTSKAAIVTQTVIFGSDPPEITKFDLDYEKDAQVYPTWVGCPVDCHIYTFNDFQCKNEREFKMYFSKNQVDLGGGPAYVMGPAAPNLDAIDLLYPCTRT